MWFRTLSASNPKLAHDRNAALDGLRGYAAITVLFYHTILACDPQLIGGTLNRGVQAQSTAYGVLVKIALALLNGEVAVSIFFVISGIVLFRSLRRKGHAPGLRPALAVSWRFSVQRILRIWPVMAVCLAVKVGLFQSIARLWPGSVGAPTTHDLLLNLFLVKIPVHGATWTLLVEFAAVPLLLAAFFAVRRWGGIALVPFAAYAGLAALGHPRLLWGSPWLIAGLPLIVAGMAIECGWLDWLMRPPLRNAAALAALPVLLTATLFIPTSMPKLHATAFLVSVPVLVAWVYVAHEGAVGRFLQSPLSLWLGLLSYSFYLWNVPVFELLLSSLDREMIVAHPLETGLLVGLATCVITIPIAHLSERWIEQPGIRLGRLLTRPRGVRAVSDLPPPPRPVSIVTVGFDSLFFVQLLVTQVRARIGSRPYEIIVVDRGSTDGSREWLRAQADVRLLTKRQSRRGDHRHGEAAEYGARKARHPVVVLLDSDAHPIADDWLALTADRLDAQTRIAGAEFRDHHAANPHGRYIHPHFMVFLKSDLGGLIVLRKLRGRDADTGEEATIRVLGAGLKILGHPIELCEKFAVGHPRVPTQSAGVFHAWYSTRLAKSDSAVSRETEGAVTRENYLEPLLARLREAYKINV